MQAMNFWFVNQTSTAKHEGNETYLWCPKKAKGGRTFQYYENIRRIKPGDVVLSFFKGNIQGFGTAQTYSYTYLRPPHYGGTVWMDLGWRCDVSFSHFQAPVNHRKHTPDLLPHLYTRAEGECNPLDKNGRIHQGSYLSRIKPEFVEVIAKAAANKELLDILRHRKTEIDEGQALDIIGYRHTLIDDLAMRNLENEYDADSVRDLLRARYGLGVFRKHVARFEQSCRITNQLHGYALVACHIKPWREASGPEKLDGANGLLLDPRAARLFNYGLFSFEDNGSIIKSDAIDKDDALTHSLFKGKPAKKTFNKEQKHFLQHHREYVLLNPYKKK